MQGNYSIRTVDDAGNEVVRYTRYAKATITPWTENLLAFTYSDKSAVVVPVHSLVGELYMEPDDEPG